MSDRPPYRVDVTAYGLGPADTIAYVTLSGELRLLPATEQDRVPPDPVPEVLRRLRELTATVDRLIYGTPRFPLFYRAPRPALPPAPARPALMPPSP